MTVTRADRAAWQSARTLADLGELTACWLEGTVPSVPGYGAPDPETAELVPVLARLNRAGFVTTCSQPAFDRTGYDGARWQQCAAVEAFASRETARAVFNAAWDAGLFAIAHDPASLPRWRFRTRTEVAATWRDREEYTWFGAQIPRRYIRGGLFAGGLCCREGMDAFCSAWQVAVIDPERGRDDVLWRVLERAVTT